MSSKIERTLGILGELPQISKDSFEATPKDIEGSLIHKDSFTGTQEDVKKYSKQILYDAYPEEMSDRSQKIHQDNVQQMPPRKGGVIVPPRHKPLVRQGAA